MPDDKEKPEELKETPKRSAKSKQADVPPPRAETPKVDSLEVIRTRKQAHQLKLRGGK